MTLRLRWTISIVAILGLFGLNLAVYGWGNARRSELVKELKVALERKDLTAEIANNVDDRQRDAEVMEPLVMSGAVVLEAAELEEMMQRNATITADIERLESLSESSRIGGLARHFDRLSRSWVDLYQGRGSETYDELHRDLALFLADREVVEVQAVARAEQDFAAVTELTDRVTLAIFAASSLLAGGIALWFSTFLRGALARYVTAEVAANVLDTKSGLQLGGEKREITVLMADLRGFSGLAEKLPAEHVVAVINNFLGAMTDIIVSAGGTIDEFIGDAILVFFGAPAARSDHADAAVVCALHMQMAMGEVNSKNRREGFPEVEMGIGIHSGEVVVGNIGSEKRMKYGAVGSSVNLASRIESHTVGGQILISEATRDLVEAPLLIDRRLEIRPKGIEAKIALFDVRGIDGSELRLGKPEDEMTATARPVPVRFCILEGKEASTDRFDGQITRISERGAEIRSRVSLPPLTNVKVEIASSRAPAGGASTYAKVVETGDPAESEDTFVVRFTSVGAAFSEAVQDYRASGIIGE